MSTTDNATEDTAQAAEPIIKTYYKWTKLGEGVGYYQGETGEQDETLPLPDQATWWAPPLVSDTTTAYWDSYGWFVGVLYSPDYAEKLASTAILEISVKYESMIRDLQAGYDPVEVSTWQKQEADARSSLALGTPTVFIQAMADAQGIRASDLITSIISKADAYGKKLGDMLGAYHKELAAVDPANYPLTKENLQLVFGMGANL